MCSTRQLDGVTVHSLVCNFTWLLLPFYVIFRHLLDIL